MAFWRKQPLQHDWLPTDEVIATGLVQLAEPTPDLDDGYLAVLDSDFAEIHHWPESMLSHLKRGLAAGRRTRHSLTKTVALFVSPDEPETVLGLVTIDQLGVANEALQLGLHLLPDYRGRGIVSGVLPLIVDRLEQVAGYERVAMSMSESNTAMIRVCEKLGYDFEVVQFRHLDGTVETARRYTVLPR